MSINKIKTSYKSLLKNLLCLSILKMQQIKKAKKFHEEIYFFFQRKDKGITGFRKLSVHPPLHKKVVRSQK